MTAANANIPAATSPGAKAESILAAAQRTFLANGFGAASMDAIAREAGASKATVYAYFASKEELFGAVVARESERYAQEFSSLALDPGDVTASLQAIAERFLHLLLSPEVLGINRIIVGEVTRFPALAEVFWRAGPERTRIQTEGFLLRAAEVGALRVPDPRLAAEQFASLVRGELHLRALLGLIEPADSAAISAAASRAVATFLRAFGTDAK
jgi:TetR/AcrR family transcriptional regulator, mexJK operon transcriptional repressor